MLYTTHKRQTKWVMGAQSQFVVCSILLSLSDTRLAHTHRYKQQKAKRFPGQSSPCLCLPTLIVFILALTLKRYPT